MAARAWSGRNSWRSARWTLLGIAVAPEEMRGMVLVEGLKVRVWTVSILPPSTNGQVKLAQLVEHGLGHAVRIVGIVEVVHGDQQQKLRARLGLQRQQAHVPGTGDGDLRNAPGGFDVRRRDHRRQRIGGA